MKRVDFPLKNCEVCGVTMRRKRYGWDRQLEKPAQYARRKTCGRRSCHGIVSERGRAQTFREMRPAANVPMLTEIATENGLSVETCSRCSDVFLRPSSGRSARRTRCDYCRRNGGATRVSYVRGYAPIPENLFAEAGS